MNGVKEGPLIAVQDNDPTGNPTIGYGHLCQQAGCAEIPYAIPLSEEDGKALLADDVIVRLTYLKSPS